VRAHTRRDWGGYAGDFLDAEGNAREVAHNPHTQFDDRGALLGL
jgi:hypothetical protein